MTSAEFFSGRIYRLGSSTPLDGCFREIFILGMGDDPEHDFAKVSKHLADWPSRWVIDIQEFQDLPKRMPAVLYQRNILTTATADDFLRDYVEGVQFMPEGGRPLRAGLEPVPMAAYGDVEQRQQGMDIMVRAMKFDPADPWYDARIAYQYYGARVFIAVAGGFEETVWFTSAGYEVDPVPGLTVQAQARAEQVGGALLLVDEPFVADNLGSWVGTQLIVSRTYREAPGGPEEFDARIVSLSRWGQQQTPNRGAPRRRSRTP